MYGYDEITKSALDMGFLSPFFTRPLRLEAWRRAANDAGLNKLDLLPDAQLAHPLATCIILLIYPYAPFSPDTLIPAYYLASNRSYHLTQAIIDDIRKSGRYAEKARIPLRAAFLENGIGSMSTNGLLRFNEYGSRIVLSGIATDAVLPKATDIPPTPPCPGECDACIRACPSLALSIGGITQSKCMRYYMDNTPYPPFVYEHMRQHLGCEICMYACPQNTCLASGSPSSHEAHAFDLERLATGDDADARMLVGKNFTRHSKLKDEAIHFLSRNKNKKPII